MNIIKNKTLIRASRFISVWIKWLCRRQHYFLPTLYWRHVTTFDDAETLRWHTYRYFRRASRGDVNTRHISRHFKFLASLMACHLLARKMMMPLPRIDTTTFMTSFDIDYLPLDIWTLSRRIVAAAYHAYFGRKNAAPIPADLMADWH